MDYLIPGMKSNLMVFSMHVVGFVIGIWITHSKEEDVLEVILLDVRHFAGNCHTLRCFTCGGFGHNAQVCASPSRQSMRSL